MKLELYVEENGNLKKVDYIDDIKFAGVTPDTKIKDYVNQNVDFSIIGSIDLFKYWWNEKVENCYKNRCAIPQDEEYLLTYKMMLKDAYLKRYSCSNCAFNNYDDNGCYCILNPDFHSKNKDKNKICKHYADSIAKRHNLIANYLKYYTIIYKKYKLWLKGLEKGININKYHY